MARNSRRAGIPGSGNTRPTDTPTSIYADIGVSGLKRSGGFITEEFVRELYGTRAVKVYREMSDNSPVVGAILFAISMLMRQAPIEWRASEEPGGEAGAEFMEAVVKNMDGTWADFIADVMSMLTFGWAWFEIIYRRMDDGKIGLKKLDLRSQESLFQWAFDGDDGPLAGMWQQPPSGRAAVFIPIEKSLLFRTTAYKGNPEGRSILRTAYRPWYFLTRIENIEAIGIERDLCGLPVMRIPADVIVAGGQAYQDYKRMITRLRRDEQEGVVLPSTRDPIKGEYLYDLALLSTAGSRQMDTVAVKDGYKRDIAMSVLADFIFLGQKSVGSFALSSDKTELFATAIGGWMDMISEVINTVLIPRLWKLNAFPPETMPTYTPGDLEKPDLEKLGTYLERLSKAGAPLFPDDELQRHLHRIADLPEPSGEALDHMMTQQQGELDLAQAALDAKAGGPPKPGGGAAQ